MNTHQVMWILAVILVLIAGWVDWRTRRIPNWLTVSGFLFGIAANSLLAGWQGAKSSVEGAGLALLLLLPLVLLRAFGAGDWKLMAAVGAFLGPVLCLFVLFGSILVSGLMAIVEVMRRGRVVTTFRNMVVLVRGFFSVAGMFTRIEDCANRALITPVAENELIIESKLSPKEAGAGLPATIPEGMRALSVAVNEVVGVAGFVIPGTMVDVLVTGSVVGSRDQNNITRTILENVRVLAAGQKIEQDREGKPQTVPVITLLVTPADAAKLAMASTEGKIQLALRNTIDSKMVNPPPVLQATLFAGIAPPPRHVGPGKPAPPPTVPYSVEIIIGTKRENKSFPNQ